LAFIRITFTQTNSNESFYKTCKTKTYGKTENARRR